MGYINPSPEEQEERGFPDQFQWDGHGWLFRRYHRARPVRVTADEMDQSITYYEVWKGRISKAAIAVTVLAMIVWAYLDRNDLVWVPGLAALAIASVGWVASHWAWQKATERFVRRVPVGTGQSWLEDRQTQLADRSWWQLLGPIALLAISGYVLWPPQEKHWFEIATGAIVGLSAVFDLILKLRARLL